MIFFSLSIEEQSDVIMSEYNTGWAARAAQEPDDQILKSGIEPVRDFFKIFIQPYFLCVFSF